MSDQDFEGDGILGGNGMQHFQRVSEQPLPTGYQFGTRCVRCGTSLAVQISWHELIVASCSQIPIDEEQQPWVFDRNRGVMFPRVQCHCNQDALVEVPITPDKAQRLCRAGMSGGLLNPQWHAQKMREVQQAVAARRQGR